MNVEIRQATNADTGDIVRIIQAVHEEYGFSWEEEGYHGDLYDVQASYILPGGMFWLMLLDATPICTCGIKRRSEELCELYRLYLLAEHRGKGLGNLMFEHSIGWSRAQGFRQMAIWSDVKLTDAHRLYEKRGAKLLGERICDDPDNSLEHGFLLDL